MSGRYAYGALVGALAAIFAGTEAAAIEPMSPQQIIDLGKHAVGYSYWWGHGRFRTDGASPGSCSGSCPGCTHTGQYGGDCSGFAAKAWQIPKPIPLDQDAHPYSTYHFTNQTTHWTSVPKESAALADAFVYNVDGAGHIFLYEKGDPWGYVHAYECKGCSYGCTYGSRKADAKYKVIRRNALTGGCKAHCEGSKIFGDDCGQGDCAAFGATCVDDALGVRCVFGACPPTGELAVCLDDKTIGHCKDGQITTGDCSAFAAFCSTAGGQPAHCASVFCVGSPQDIPEAHDICFLDGKRYHCDAAGLPTEKPCEAGSQCSTHPEVHCKPGLGCPPSGTGTKVCFDDRVMVECHEGAGINASDCGEIDAYCSALLGEPRCVSAACVSGPQEAPSEKLTCAADGQLAHCKADGTVSFSACPDGTSCQQGACAAGASGAAGSPGSAGVGGNFPSGGSGVGGDPQGQGNTGGLAGGATGGKAGAGGAKGKESTVVTTGEVSESGGCSAAGQRGRGGWGVLLAFAALGRRRRRGVAPG
jgi:hypothetical protein